MDNTHEDWSGITFEINRVCEERNIQLTSYMKRDIIGSIVLLRAMGVFKEKSIEDLVVMSYLEEKYKKYILYPFFFIN